MEKAERQRGVGQEYIFGGIAMRKKLIVVLLIAALFMIATIFNSRGSERKLSSFGEYQGYSEEIYDSHTRRSDYLTLSNGTRLAYDLILPMQGDSIAVEPLPVLFKYTPYLRAFTIFDEQGQDIISPLYYLTWLEKAMLRVRYWTYERGHLMDALFLTQWLEPMVKHGYAVVVVERTGTGASFGRMDPSFETAALEVNEILDWIAMQPWSNGNIGMYGDSWEGQIQIAAASTGNPHLKAIFPVSASIDNYSSVVYPGGVYNEVFGTFFSWANSFFESDVLTPVDHDDQGVALAQARAERSDATVGDESAEFFANFPYRDSTGDEGTQLWGESFALYPFIDRINQAGVPIYLVNGWYDLFTRDMFLLYENLTVPRRLVVRPMDHSELPEKGFDLDIGAEAHRWFDHWLKGIDNGIMQEPPITYFVMEGDEEGYWQTSQAWPPGSSEPVRFSFAAGRSGSVASANDGLLDPGNVPADAGSDRYQVDYSTTSGPCPRWCSINWGREYEDMRLNDEKALTYTSSVLQKPLEISGHPLVQVWLETEAPDLDLFVYLEDVDPRGRSTYITEGILRASQRTLGLAPYDNLGLPYHTFFESDLQAVPVGDPFLLKLDLLPTSYRFEQGHRIRLTVAFSDAGHFATPMLSPAPVLRVLRGGVYESYLELPISSNFLR